MPGELKAQQHRHGGGVHRRRRHWCCTFSPPLSPDYLSPSSRSIASSSMGKKTAEGTFFSPHGQNHLRPPFARRILSPGRVSPISDHPVVVTQDMNKNLTHTKSPLVPPDPQIGALTPISSRNFDVRLNARGRNGESLVLELGSKVLAANSPIFADLIASNANRSNSVCRIEVADVENLNAFRETIELVFEEDIQKKLQKVGVFRAINILEVSAGIKFGRGVTSCLRYLDAVPWTEEEEEKLRESFGRFKYEDDESAGILDRLDREDLVDSQRTLTKNLIFSITSSNDIHARNEMKSLVKGLLGRSSVYEKNYADLKQHVIEACEMSLASLTEHLLGAYGGGNGNSSVSKTEKDRPLLRYISKHVEDVNWLLDILIDHQMAEEFVDLWASQQELLKLHRSLSSMVRYELSRVSASLFIAIGDRKLHCRSGTRLRLFQTWFEPMLYDFSWLQRCKKGLDMETLEESIGQVLLTLPFNEQYALFMEWFHCLSKISNDCPNLSKAFQIWWRRSLLRGSDPMLRSQSEVNRIAGNSS